MTEIPESLLRRSAEAKAKALGLSVEQVLAEMKGEAPPTLPSAPEPEPEEAVLEEAVEEVPPAARPPVENPVVEVASEPVVTPEAPHAASALASEPPETEPDEAAVEAAEASEPEMGETPEPQDAPAPAVEDLPAAAVETAEEPAAVATLIDESAPATEGNRAGNGKVAATVSPRPVVPPAGTPEGVRTQRLLTVVKARAIQTVKAEPTDKVNTWPHLMLMEFGALLAITGFLVILAVIIHSPLLAPANFNSTPNPSKAPWYFLGLQELLSYFDPQIAGVTVPTITGMIGFMMVPYVDKNPSTRPSDRKFAIALYSTFLAGAATLTIIGVLFRGRGFNFSYPWKDGVFFDDLKDWVQFE
ncbi:MAG TPA: hypothetical protein VJA46_13840 [Acidimicrobiia bacterium]|nr:hypothetical protein [Acidimicrobiia bacterium]